MAGEVSEGTGSEASRCNQTAEPTCRRPPDSRRTPRNMISKIGIVNRKYLENRDKRAKRESRNFSLCNSWILGHHRQSLKTATTLMTWGAPMTGVPTPSHWRQAMAIAAQMPPDEADALLVLDCVEEILRLSFGSPPTAPVDPDDGQLLRFPGGQAVLGAAPRRAAGRLAFQNRGSPTSYPGCGARSAARPEG